MYADGGGLCWPVSYRLEGVQVCSSAWSPLTASWERRRWLRGVLRTEEAATELRGETVVDGEDGGRSRSESEPFSTDEVVSSAWRDDARKNGRGGDNFERV